MDNPISAIIVTLMVIMVVAIFVYAIAIVLTMGYLLGIQSLIILGMIVCTIYFIVRMELKKREA